MKLLLGSYVLICNSFELIALLSNEIGSLDPPDYRDTIG
jgi:hypothetical protein